MIPLGIATLVQRLLFRGKAPPIEVEYPKQRDDVVSTYEATGLWSSLIGGEKYNPDDLVAQKGMGIYAKMLNDEQVKSVTEFKLNAILGRGWHFKYDQTKLAPDEQKKRIRVFEAITKKIRGSFLDAVEGIASGREFGYSVSEKIYGQITYDGATFKGLNMILTRDPASFRFFPDEYGILKRIKQQVAGRADVDVDLDKVVHYVHKPKWDTTFGRSELRAAYRAWYLKDITLKLWAIHLERFGSGIPVATRTGEGGSAAFGTPEFASLQRVMENFKAHTGIILPPGFTAQVLFPTSTDQFEKALQYHDLAIAKSQLVPNLLGLSHTGQTGAYSQSQTQFEAFFWTTSTDGSRISECLNEQVFRDLGDQNWGDGDYPYFCFKPMTLDNAIKLLTAFKDMIGAGMAQVTEDDERFLRELLEMPERDPDAEPLVDPMAERQQTHTEEQAQITNDQRQQELDQQANQAKAANSDRYTAAPPQAINVTVHNPAQAAPNVSVFAFDPSQPRDDHGRWSESGALSEDESVAVTSYKEDGYRYVNAYVSGKTDGMSDAEIEQASYEAGNLDSAISKSSLSKDATLYRGFNNASVAANAEKLVGRTIGSDKFLSTSRSEDVAKAFAGKGQGTKGAVVFRIRAAAGTHALDVNSVLGKDFGESEMILSNRTQIRVTGVSRAGGVTYVDGEIGS